MPLKHYTSIGQALGNLITPLGRGKDSGKSTEAWWGSGFASLVSNKKLRTLFVSYYSIHKFHNVSL